MGRPSAADTVSGSLTEQTTSDAEVLRVSIKPVSPFVFIDDDPATPPSGYSIELWNRVAQRLGVTTEWVERDKVGEVVDDVAAGAADVGIAAISVTAEREGRLDFSYPYFDSGLQVLVSSQGDDRGFLSAFSWIWSKKLAIPLVVFLFIIVLFGHMIWWVERQEEGDFPRRYGRGIVEGMWWSLATVTGGDAEKSVNRPIGRLISAVWLLFGMFLVAYVTGLVSSSLTVNKLQSSVTGFEDLPGKSVVCVPETVAGRYLESRGVPYQKVESIDVAIQMVAAGDADATVYDAPVLAYHAATSVRGRVQVVGPIFQPDKYSIAFPTDSELREEVNGILLTMQADGSLQELYDKWFK